ncbi:MAG: DCC1-like thiol-disulfide oxidoreductase family protein [Akkermansiaceae bacterium]
MNLPIHVNSIAVYYYGRWGICCTFHEWINRRGRAFEIRFIPYRSPGAEEEFPGNGALDPAREMIVRTGAGATYRSAEAWVWCLFSCAHHRSLARRLAKPAMLAVAVRVWRILASNRHSFSKAFFRLKDRKVREALNEMKSPECKNDLYVIDHDEWRAELMR